MSCCLDWRKGKYHAEQKNRPHNFRVCKKGWGKAESVKTSPNSVIMKNISDNMDAFQNG